MDAPTYKQLPESYKKNGFIYDLVARTEHVAMYGQNDAENGHFVAYEVCRILRHDGRTIGASYVPPAEFLPSSEQWGSQAWTLTDERAAHAKYTEQNNRLAA
jgi:hypothetical protein